MNIPHVFRGPRMAGQEPICLLDRETAGKRIEPSDRILPLGQERFLTNGVEYSFSRKEVEWSRVMTYIEEERQCCPFLAFEAFQEKDFIRLIVFQPYEDQA